MLLDLKCVQFDSRSVQIDLEMSCLDDSLRTVREAFRSVVRRVRRIFLYRADTVNSLIFSMMSSVSKM